MTAPARALGGGGGTAGALAQAEGAVATVGQTLGGVTQKVGGAVTALQTGGAASLLTGRIETGAQAVSGAIANAPAELKTLETSAQALFSPSNLAAIEAPYQTLFSTTAVNLQSLGSAMSANPSASDSSAGFESCGSTAGTGQYMRKLAARHEWRGPPTPPVRRTRR